MNNQIIAIDFDGTIVEDRFPAIGKPMPFALETLKMLENDGYRLILWTYRHGSKLEEAVEFLTQHGINLYAVNRSYPDEKSHPSDVSRKIHADIFIDDRNYGGFPGWGVIYQNLSQQPPPLPQSRKSIFSRLFKSR